jgi:hypothetical protein
MLADVFFGTIWEAVAGALPDSVAISEPDRDYAYAEFGDRHGPGILHNTETLHENRPTTRMCEYRAMRAADLYPA